jgi:hypothetical protein
MTMTDDINATTARMTAARRGSAMHAAIVLATAALLDGQESAPDRPGTTAPDLCSPPNDPDLAAQYRAERAARKAANFAKRSKS